MATVLLCIFYSSSLCSGTDGTAHQLRPYYPAPALRQARTIWQTSRVQLRGFGAWSGTSRTRFVRRIPERTLAPSPSQQAGGRPRVGTMHPRPYRVTKPNPRRGAAERVAASKNKRKRLGCLGRPSPRSIVDGPGGSRSSKGKHAKHQMHSRLSAAMGGPRYIRYPSAWQWS